ncbi:unnamed protein product [Larinioides sclopetarius]|uniref:VWFC domain-containing protein n=1 Tax=Larinioides sclopetarius TaxID=280406 RepID=A0AAV2AQ25_9ARAC
MASLIKYGVFFVLFTNGVLGRFLPEEIFQNTSNRSSNGERQEDCNCEWRFYQHYEAKGCQIVQTDSCGCPTNYLCSSVKQSVSQSEVCMYQSVAYKVGEKIKLADNCQVCRCVDGITPQVVCRQRECPQLDPVEGENCHLVYEENKCCPSRYECIEDVPENASEASAFTCIYNNITYPFGAKIYPPDDPCLVCECKEDWNGLNNSSCYQQECVFEKKKHLLEAGCIPIYHERRCCPIEYYCPEDLHYNNMELRELEGENSTENELQTEENPETEEYFIQFQSHDTEDVENHLAPNELRQKRSENMQTDEIQTQQSQQQWNILQEDEDEMETGETIERERELSEESNEGFDEIKAFGSKGPNTPPVVTVELEDTDFDNVIWTSIVPGCPTPLCADSSCRIGVPQGHRCPTCICKKARQP